jgi:hypothetical protein
VIGDWKEFGSRDLIGVISRNFLDGIKNTKTGGRTAGVLIAIQAEWIRPLSTRLPAL